MTVAMDMSGTVAVIALIGLVLWGLIVVVAIALGAAAKRGDQQAKRFRKDDDK